MRSLRTRWNIYLEFINRRAYNLKEGGRKNGDFTS